MWLQSSIRSACFAAASLILIGCSKEKDNDPASPSSSVHGKIEPGDFVPKDQKDQNKNTPAAKLPAEIVAEWEKAGAKARYLRINRFSQIELVNSNDGKAGDIPAFSIAWNKMEGALAKLPDAGVFFGLFLSAYPPITDELPKELTALKNLKALAIEMGIGVGVTNAGLKKLAELKGLQWLGLYGSKVTDEGLNELASLSDLRHLSLGSTEISGVGFKDLIVLNSLQSLDLGNTKVTDIGLKEIIKLKNVQSLTLDSTKITDAGLKELSSMKGLQSLNLREVRITDDGLADLASMAGLQSLDLRGVKITDVGLKHLTGMTNLQSLDLVDTKVTDAGVRDLKKALPKCRVERY